MVKQKQSEEKEAEERKCDGLEIISIGSLYSGSWDKKYWSSSRGKDRYPYPVGYHARRSHNGGVCKLEINQGPNGPLFVITSGGDDGSSCSGQTPDMAWEKFQKRGGFQGKRISSRVDGIEFFGFKNPHVQRLLRELVANVNVIAERSLVPSNLSNGVCESEQNNQCQEASGHLGLLAYLAKTRATGKRSKRCGIVNPKVSSAASGLKKPRLSEVVNSTHESIKERNSLGPSTSRDNQERGCCRLSGASPGKDGLASKFVDDPDHLRESVVLSIEETKGETRANWTSNIVVSNLSAEERQLGRSLVTEVEEAQTRGDSQGGHNGNHCVPDTLDFQQDFTCSMKEELPAANMIISEGLAAESCPEDETAISNSNASSEKSDFVSVGHEIAKTMMTVLLPQAIPLLNKTSSKKKDCIKSSENLCSAAKPQEESNGIEDFIETPSHAADPAIAKTYEHTKIFVPDSIDDDQNSSESFPSAAKPQEESNKLGDFMGAPCPAADHAVAQYEHNKTFVPDSIDGDLLADHILNHRKSPSDNALADQPCRRDAYSSYCKEEFGNVEVESSVCHAESTGARDTLSHTEMSLASCEMTSNDYVHSSDSIGGQVSSSKEIICEESKDIGKDLDASLAGVEIHIKQKDSKRPQGSSKDLFGLKFQLSVHSHYMSTAAATMHCDQTGMGRPVPSAGEDSITIANTAETTKESTSQVPKIVYSRKKGRDSASKATNKSAPLLESIICRNFVDGHVPESTGPLPHPGTVQMSLSIDKSLKNDYCVAELFVEGQGCSVLSDKTASNSNPELAGMAAITSHIKTPISASEGKDGLDLFHPATLHVDEPQVNVEEQLDKPNNTSGTSNKKPFYQHEASSFYNNTVTVSEVEANSDPKLQKNLELNNELEGIVRFLGCYFLPMPVSLLLLNTRGNEIYICALCGLQLHENRTAFLYKLQTEDPNIGCPAFVGHTSVTLPSSTDIFGKEVPEGSRLQLTPDCQCLALIGSIKAPYCREGRTDCKCLTCISDCLDHNCVKIVQVKAGHVSLLVKLRTVDRVQCVLVSEPDRLVAAGESGRLYVWIMNSTWSAPTEECSIPLNDYPSSSMVELKRIPKFDSLVIGHDGFGEFTLWDISRHIVISRFCTPSTSPCQFYPVCYFNWQREGSSSDYLNFGERIDGILNATRLWLSDHHENHSISPLEVEDIAIWLLVSTESGYDAQDDYLSNDFQRDPHGYWRLALLEKNKLIMGTTLDPRAAAIGTSAEYGIIGTLDGLVYMWELLTGTKVGTLHHFKGSNVSCIATDDSSSGILAVADDRGQLLVYRRLQCATD